MVRAPYVATGCLPLLFAALTDRSGHGLAPCKLFAPANLLGLYVNLAKRR